MKKKLVLAALIILFGLFIWVKLDSSAVIRMVAAVRLFPGGDYLVMNLENRYFAYQDQRDQEFTLSHNLEFQVVKAQQKADELFLAPQPKPASKYGQWIKKDWYARTILKPDAKRSGVVNIIVFDGQKTNLHFVSGAKEPVKGGVGKISPEDFKKVQLAFSGGFLQAHLPSGCIDDGKVLKPLLKGQGTITITKDGKAKIGTWGVDFKIKDTPFEARQGLHLIEKGKFNSKVGYWRWIILKRKKGEKRVEPKTDPATFLTAIGTTAEGNLVYAGGRQLLAQGLALAMIGLGVTEAICLDMNYGNAFCYFLSYDGKHLKTASFSDDFPKRNDKFCAQEQKDFFYITTLK